MSKLNVKFLIDEVQNRVVFAEAKSDFVDVLFSLLTLPLGSIVKLLDKQSGLGSLDNLYESVEQLDITYLQTEACKEMLLNPRSATAIQCEDLKIKNIHDRSPRNIYICSKKDCFTISMYYYNYSYSKKCQCNCCGNQMVKTLCHSKKTVDGGVFVKEGYGFMISPDFQVMPASFTKGSSLLNEMQIKGSSVLGERIVEFDKEQVLNLLTRSLISKDVLTEFCFPDACIQSNVGCFLPIKKEMDSTEEHDIILDLLLNKKDDCVIGAEVGEDFVNHLLGFLTIPLGSVLRSLPDNISLGGCIVNLYKSVEILSLNMFKSEICRNLLLTPKLSTFYGFKNQIPEMEEITSQKWDIKGCTRCFFDNEFRSSNYNPCMHGQRSDGVEQNPKSKKGVTAVDEFFIGKPSRFLVSDNLCIVPFSFTAAIAGLNLQKSDFYNKEVSMGKSEVLLLMGAMLVSKTVFTDIFCPKRGADK